MGKTNKQYRSLDEKQHHVSKAIKKEYAERTVRNIDRAIKNRRYEQFYDEIDYDTDQEYLDEK